jgi:hypothetical protein
MSNSENRQVMADVRSVLGEPFLKVRELDRSGLLQCARGKSTYPVVVDVKGGGNGAMLPDPRFNLFPRLLNALFYRHAC